MNLSIINDIAEELALYLIDKGVASDDGFDAIYANDTTPSSDLPDTYLEVLGNGPMFTRVSQGGVKDYTMMLVLNIRLLSIGSVNTVRENYLLDLLDNHVGDNLTIGKFHYSVDKNSMVYSGKSLTDGYSTKIININVKIY
jgi:hypothetical protein